MMLVDESSWSGGSRQNLNRIGTRASRYVTAASSESRAGASTDSRHSRLPTRVMSDVTAVVIETREWATGLRTKDTGYCCRLTSLSACLRCVVSGEHARVVDRTS
jgi:hypothetical protein